MVCCQKTGKWCEGVAKVGWFERKIASALFSTPPTATYEEALGYYIKADKLDPQFKDNVKALGDLCVMMGKKADAKVCTLKCLYNIYVQSIRTFSIIINTLQLCASFLHIVICI